MILIAPCHFGTEAILKKEIFDLGYELERVEDGRVYYVADEQGIALSNIFVRSAERIMIQVGRFNATTFEELFDKTSELEWEKYLPRDAKFWVTKASSVKSRLFSPRDIQSIVKKAIVKRLSSKYNINWFEENGNDYPIRVMIKKDEVVIALDTTGTSLHKRGYRKAISKAPISETLAASLIMLTPWKKSRALIDPFCGCGTIPIEAAMIACNIAPGMNRDFISTNWDNIILKNIWNEAYAEAKDLVDVNSPVDIMGSDIDPQMREFCIANLQKLRINISGIRFETRDAATINSDREYGFVITNPPYGERLEDIDNIKPLYADFGNTIKNMPTWSSFVVTSFDEMERYFGLKATKKRKIYNGMIKTNFYQFMGPKPPKDFDLKEK